MDEGTLFLHAEPMPAGNYAARHPHKSSWTVSRKSLDAETKLTPKETALLALFGERREIPLEEVQAEFGGDCLTFLRKAEGKGLLALKQELHRSEYKNEKRLYSLDRDHPLLEAAWKKAEKEKRLEGQRLLLEYLASGREATAAELKEALGITDSPIKTLLKKGILRERRQTERRNVFDADTVERTQPFTPTAEQAAALSALHRELEQEEKKPVLLHGVTGSGKTEIYMQIIAGGSGEGRAGRLYLCRRLP